MAIDALGGLVSIPGPERPKHQIRTLASRETGQPIDTPVLAHPVSRLNVVGVSILRKTRSFGLFCREETLLAFRDLVEPLGSLFALFSHNTILQLI
jgi:hypothetical protein